MSGIAFQDVGNLRPGKTAFNLSHENKFDMDMGELIPICIMETYPGDYFEIDCETLVRAMPLIAPIMHEITISTHWFFCPTRILDDTNNSPGSGNPKKDAPEFRWQEFISGGIDGMDEQTPPRWKPVGDGHTPTPKYGLWDYLGFPLANGPTWTSPLTPVDFPRRMYNLIWNEYYRDETLQEPVDWTNENILHRGWRKDYFTSALPFQQRGIQPALPVNVGGIAGSTKFYGPDGNQVIYVQGHDNNIPYPNGWLGVTTGYLYTPPGQTQPKYRLDGPAGNQWADFGYYYPPQSGTTSIPRMGIPIEQPTGYGTSGALGYLNNNVLDARADLITTFDIADMRLAFQLQKWMERNARGGVRYPELIKAHFDEDVKDSRIQRPEYIGGTKSPFIISEVIQTSETNTSAQGTLAGHGISAAGNNVGSYKCTEWGWIMGLISIMPKPSYQEGINRQFLREVREDYYWAEFANLSEQGIVQGEIYIAGDGTDLELFGYQGRYDELRIMEDRVCGAFRDTLRDWHLGRVWGPGNAPKLNAEFIECRPRKDIYAVPSEKGLLVTVANLIRAVRPMPSIAEPGLIDHH